MPVHSSLKSMFQNKILYCSLLKLEYSMLIFYQSIEHYHRYIFEVSLNLILHKHFVRSLKTYDQVSLPLAYCKSNVTIISIFGTSTIIYIILFCLFFPDVDILSVNVPQSCLHISLSHLISFDLSQVLLVFIYSTFQFSESFCWLSVS